MPELIDLLDQVDEMRDEIVALERDMVRIPTVNTGFMPTGNETELCRYVERWLAEDGPRADAWNLGQGRSRLNAKGRLKQSRYVLVPPSGRSERKPVVGADSRGGMAG